MAVIQLRNGAYEDYDSSKMHTAELAVITSGDPATDDGKSLNVCYAASDSRRVLTEDDVIAQKIWTGTCSTSASTTAKVVTLDNPEGFSLTEGVTIAVYFSNRNSATTPTLNVNDTGAVPIKYSTHSSDYSIADPYSRWGIGIKFFTYHDSAWFICFAEMADIAYLSTVKASLNSPALTGAPTAPTASNSTNSTQIATTAFVKKFVPNAPSTQGTYYLKCTVSSGGSATYKWASS